MMKMRGIWGVGLLVCVALASNGCRTREGTLVEVTVGAVGTLDDVARLAVTASVGDQTRSFDVPLATKSIPPEHVFGIEVPGNRTGTITVTVDARSANGSSVGTKTASVGLVPGSVVKLPLVIGSPDVDMAGGGDDGGGTDGGVVDMKSGPVVTPAMATLGAGRWVQLMSDTAVTWTVVGGDANGTISASGIYNAPFTPGSYTVTATSAAGMTDVVMTVKPLVVRLIGGRRGGFGNSDGVGDDAHFGNAVKLAGDPPEIYATDRDNHTVRRINLSFGSVTTILGVPGQPGGADGIGPDVRFDRPTATAAFDTLYVEDGSNRIRKINKQSLEVQTLSVAGTIDSSFVEGLVGIVGTDLVKYDPTVPSATTLLGGFSDPRAVAGKGPELYVAENTVIKRVTKGGSTWSAVVIAGNGTTTGMDDPTGTNASFRNILDIAVVDGSWLVVVDGDCTLRKVSLSSPYAVTTLAGAATDCQYVDGPNSAARFAGLSAVHGTNNGFVLVVDNGDGGSGIRKVDITSGTVSTVVGRPTTGYGFGVDGPAATAIWTPAYALAIDGERLLLPAPGNGKPSSHSIRTIALADNAVGTLAGNAEVFGSANGAPTDARFRVPVGIAVVGTDAYVTDAGNATIRKITLGNSATSTWAGSAGMTGYVNDAGANARFNAPIGITACGPKLLVTDGSSAVRAIDLSNANVTTLAGDPAATGTTDAVGTAARFNFESTDTTFPHYPAITCDGAGNAYVSDVGNRTVRKIVVATGEVTTLTGTPGGADIVDGAPAVARFDTPSGVAHDGHRTLYVADASTLRAIDTVTGVTTTVLGRKNVRGVSLGVAPATLNQPSGLAIRSNGDLYFTDPEENVTLVVVPQP